MAFTCQHFFIKLFKLFYPRLKSVDFSMLLGYLKTGGKVKMISASEKIRIILRRKGIEQQQLAAAFGVSRQAFNNKLRRDTFSNSELERIAALLGCSVELVFTDKQTGDTV